MCCKYLKMQTEQAHNDNDFYTEQQLQKCSFYLNISYKLVRSGSNKPLPISYFLATFFSLALPPSDTAILALLPNKDFQPITA